MKFLSLSIATLLMVAGFSLSAQSNVEAKKWLNQASEKAKSYDKIYLEFDYNFVNNRVDPPVTQEESGNIAIKDDNYHLNFMGTTQIRDGAKLYTVLEMDEEVQVTEYDPEEAEQGLTPTNIFDLYKKGYSLKLGGSETKDGKNIQYVILKPNASEDIDKIMVGIDKDSKHFTSFKQWGTNGTETTFVVTSFNPQKSLPAGYFSFDKSDYPGYYIAD